MSIPTTYESALALARKARSLDKGKPVANNTRLYIDGDDVRMRLHATDVVTFHADGSLTLRAGGWYTVTTKDRIHSALAGPLVLMSRKGRWYVAQGWNDPTPVPFYEGMVIDADGSVRVEESVRYAVADEDARNAQMRKDVKRFLDGITPERIVDAFEHSGGDCLGCQMVADDGTYPMGDDCVALHVEENYFHLALLMRALRAKNFGDPAFVAQLAYTDAMHGMVSRPFFRDPMRKFLVKTLTTGAVAVA